MKIPMIVCFISILAASSCATDGGQAVKSIEFYRQEMGLNSCGMLGSIGARMADCRMKNPNYSTSRVKGSVHQWSLVQLDAISSFELWYDHSAGKVWTNAFRYKAVECSKIGSMSSGDRELKFHLAKHQEYRDAFMHKMPMRISKNESRLFVPADSAERGMVIDEKDHTLKNIQWEKPLWVRCVAD